MNVNADSLFWFRLIKVVTGGNSLVGVIQTILSIAPCQVLFKMKEFRDEVANAFLHWQLVTDVKDMFSDWYCGFP